MNYNEIKDSLRVRLMPVIGNEAILDSVPHRLYEDIAMTYFLEYPYPTIITNGMLDKWDADEERLHEDALEAAHNSCGIRFRSIGQMLRAFGEMVEDSGAFYVVTTEAPFGAWVIFYEDYMAAFAQAMNCDGYYILPSSVHELLLLPRNDLKPEELLTMVTEINRTAVAPEERLTDSVYYYDKDGFRKVA